ncbi:MAG TPA: BMP family ABC transporter substrate-binding protein, partial [Anaerolineae bacterium]|nr:BMP family ABC transporter substrate-binding protein [Anaerolineae bacterium]
MRLCCFIALMAGLSLLAAAQAVAPLAPEADTVTILAGNPIEIAAATCNTYPSSQDLLDAVQMAMDDYGPIKGFNLQRNDYDTLCDQPSGAAAAATIVANSQNVGVVGPIYSSSTFGAAPVFESAGLVMISPANTNADLPAVGPHIFNRTIPPNPAADPWLTVVEALPSVTSWEARFEAIYGRPPELYSVLAYDAATLLLTRIDEVSELVGVDLVVERAALAAAVRNTAGWPGASGPVSLEVDGDRVNEQRTTVWADQFADSTLDPDWSWIAEDPTHWSLTANPGFMRLVTQAPNNNRLVRAVPGGDFEIRTRVLFTPQENYQIAGLYVYGDEDNYLRLGRAYCDAAPPVCVGNGIYFDAVEGGVGVGGNCAMTTVIQGEAYLRLVREGANFTGYVSTDGTGWAPLCSHTVGFEPIQVGLAAGNQGTAAAEIPADFDFFALQFPTRYRIYTPLIREVSSGPFLKVGMVTDVGGIGDHSFNQNTWAGLQRAEQELGVEANYLESAAEADYETNIAAFAQEDYDLIVTVGFGMGDATSNMAPAYPGTKFSIMDLAYDPPIPNVAGVLFAVDEAAFPAGYLAAGWAVLQDAADPQIGYVAGMQIPPVEQFVVAYTAGAAYYNLQKGTAVQVKGVYVGSFTDPDEGKIQGDSLIDESVDVIFGVGGETGNGALAAARERGKWGIGVDVDQYYTLPNERSILLTSVLKRLDNAAFAVVHETQLGTFPGGGVYLGMLANQGVGLAPYHDYAGQIPAGLD